MPFSSGHANARPRLYATAPFRSSSRSTRARAPMSSASKSRGNARTRDICPSPARVQPRRGPCLQPGPRPACGASAARSRLLETVNVVDSARIGARSGHPQCRGDREGNRRILDLVRAIRPLPSVQSRFLGRGFGCRAQLPGRASRSAFRPGAASARVTSASPSRSPIYPGAAHLGGFDISARRASSVTTTRSLPAALFAWPADHPGTERKPRPIILSRSVNSLRDSVWWFAQGPIRPVGCNISQYIGDAIGQSPWSALVCQRGPDLQHDRQHAGSADRHICELQH